MIDFLADYAMTVYLAVVSIAGVIGVACGWLT